MSGLEPVTVKEMDDMLDHEIETINQMVADAPVDSFMPMMTVMCKSGLSAKPTYIGIGFANMPDDPEDRQAMMRGLGMKMWNEIEDGEIPVAVMFHGEMWQKEYDKEENIPTDGHIPDGEEKEEIVLCAGYSMTRQENAAMHTIHRNKKGEIDKLTLSMYIPVNENKSLQGNLLRQFFVGMAEAATKAQKGKK